MTAMNSIFCGFVLPENAVIETTILKPCEQVGDYVGQTLWFNQHRS